MSYTSIPEKKTQGIKEKILKRENRKIAQICGVDWKGAGFALYLSQYARVVQFGQDKSRHFETHFKNIF